jgi:hypothetical protein
MLTARPIPFRCMTRSGVVVKLGWDISRRGDSNWRQSHGANVAMYDPPFGSGMVRLCAPPPAQSASAFTT